MTNWISIEDRLPDPDKDVLVWDATPNAECAVVGNYFDGGFYWSSGMASWPVPNASHWAPIEPPSDSAPQKLEQSA